MTGGRLVELRLRLTIEDGSADADVARMVAELAGFLSGEAFEAFGPAAFGGYDGPRLVSAPRFGAEVGGEWVAGGGQS